jgi:uncharacterized membrane protein
MNQLLLGFALIVIGLAGHFFAQYMKEKARRESSGGA